MDHNLLPDNLYLLLTPGPLTTTKSVKAAMFRDWCTWDRDYNDLVQQLRADLVKLATRRDGYTAVLMQGSGTFCVEATVTTALPRDGKLLVLANGAYGDRIGKIADRIGIDYAVNDSGEIDPPDPELLRKTLASDATITHVAVVHCETTTGMLNPVAEVGKIVKEAGKVFIVDAMSSFGGVPLDMAEDFGADYLISSANKCIQGVPGFGFVIARAAELQKTEGRARSLSLDLYDQWRTMEDKHGKWRFTSPTHVVRAFIQAMKELTEEGGIAARHARYSENHRRLVAGMRERGFRTLLDNANQSPIITSFHNPESADYDFNRFYELLKTRGFVIYPGKVTVANTFRIGNIGDTHPADIDRLLAAIDESMFWK